MDASYLPSSDDNETRLLAVRREVIALRDTLQTKSAKLRDLELRAKEISGWMETLERTKQPSAELLAYLKMREGDLSLLRFRLSGMLSEINDSQEKLRLEIRQLNTMLSKLEICTACGGTGYQNKTSYERMDEGTIVPNTETRECDLCHGKGRIEL
jgi:DNA repair exonuclease SbcCD ATPase subunit